MAIFILLTFLFSTTTSCSQSNYNYLLFEATNEEHVVDGKFPLIVFLHGMGERGNDLSMVEKHGPPKMVKLQKDFPFYVLSPQCPDDAYWRGKKVNKLVQEILEQYPIDPSRIYLTGLSMGGYGTWDTAIDDPDRYAAMAPICGGDERYIDKMEAIKDIPMWVFHGRDDELVSIRGSEKLVAKAKALGASVRFTAYEETGHDSWTKSYANPELYQWFLKCVK